MIVVVDYNVSNIGSLVNMLKKIGMTAMVSNRPEDIEKADKLILPGIGSFDAGMQRLIDLNLVSLLNKKVMQEKTPALGICLGMQLMALRSTEGKLSGLSWFDAEVVRFDFPDPKRDEKIPHMGWNFTEQKKKSRLFENMPLVPKFYFVHSYHFRAHRAEDVLCVTHHGYDFVSAMENENIAGVQFHPEKSH
ncbi:MAG: imidazole glycerol phosphate synthase subunit HisH, partial [Chitinophagales bacterium]